MDIYGKNQECLEGALNQLSQAVTYSDKEPEKDLLIFKAL